jgi:hypothetical protein
MTYVTGMHELWKTCEFQLQKRHERMCTCNVSNKEDKNGTTVLDDRKDMNVHLLLERSASSGHKHGHEAQLDAVLLGELVLVQVAHLHDGAHVDLVVRREHRCCVLRTRFECIFVCVHVRLFMYVHVSL